VRAILAGEIKKYVSGREKAVRSAWEEPLLGIAAAEDPLFPRLRQAVRPTHGLPADLLPGARTVIVYFLPFAAGIPRSNRRGRHASREWAAAYVETNQLIRDLNSRLAAVLERAGFSCACPPPTHNFDAETLMSDWSHKHVAYIAGMGRFGSHHLLITSRGCAGRFGSLVTDAVIAPDTRPAGEYCLYKHNGSCGTCVKRCPSGALAFDSLGGPVLDRQRCYALCLENADLFRDEGLADVCGKCSVGVPCARVNALARLEQRGGGKAKERAGD
jgi:epoxyqueuosine reductase QueG